jgi:hypothetical protein
MIPVERTPLAAASAMLEGYVISAPSDASRILLS